MLYFNYYYFLIVVIAGETGSGFADSDIYPTDHSIEDGFKNVEEILKLDTDEVIGEKEQNDDSNNNLVWVIIIIVSLAFILLGVFNHIIIPMFCMEKTVKEGERKEEVILKMSDIEKDIKENEETTNKRGSINEGFEDIPLKTENIETERILSIENENFEKTVLKAISAIGQDTKETFDTNNREYTKTPRNSISKNTEDKGETVVAVSTISEDAGEKKDNPMEEHVMVEEEKKDTDAANRSNTIFGQENGDQKELSTQVEDKVEPLNNDEGKMLANIPEVNQESKMDNDKNEEGETPTDSLIDSKDNEKEKIN